MAIFMERGAGEPLSEEELKVVNGGMLHLGKHYDSYFLYSDEPELEKWAYLVNGPDGYAAVKEIVQHRWDYAMSDKELIDMMEKEGYIGNGPLSIESFR